MRRVLCQLLFSGIVVDNFIFDCSADILLCFSREDVVLRLMNLQSNSTGISVPDIGDRIKDTYNTSNQNDAEGSEGCTTHIFNFLLTSFCSSKDSV